MKKMLYTIILLSIFLIPSTVFAISGKVNLDCTPASQFAGDIVTCTIAAEVSDGSVKEFAGTVTLNENLEFDGTPQNSEGWTGTNANGLFTLKNTEGQTNSFEIARFAVRMKSDATGNGTITLKTTKLGDVASVPDVTKSINLSTSTTNVTDTATPNADEDTNVDIKNPDTGSHIPFMIIGGGTLIAVVGYELASHRKKLHKI